MDRNGIEKAYTSMSAPGVADCSESETTEIVRKFNDDAGVMRKSYSGRFGTFSYLPLPYVDAALKEISRVFEEIGTDGICLLTSYGDKYLGDADFVPMFDELNRRKAIVFVHPDSGPCSCNIGNVPAATLDFPFDTTRTIVSLMMGGIFQRCPDIRFVFSHAGGTVPFLVDRLSRLERIPANKELLQAGVGNMLRALYFDTALSANKYTFASLMEFADPKRILFGSDYPFAPEDTTTASILGLSQLGLSDEQLLNIERNNSLSLFEESLSKM
jgi:predicted TIM-barrel fold metal-dependent hydrolase